MAFCSSKERLLGGGLDLAKQPAILVLVSCASDGHTLLRALSTAAIISGTGILLGAGAKFKPLTNTPFSANDRGLDDRLSTHLSLGRCRCESPEDRFNKASNFLFCRYFHFSVFFRWILVRTSSKASGCGACKWNSSCRYWKNRSYLSYCTFRIFCDMRAIRKRLLVRLAISLPSWLYTNSRTPRLWCTSP